MYKGKKRTLFCSIDALLYIYAHLGASASTKMDSSLIYRIIKFSRFVKKKSLKISLKMGPEIRFSKLDFNKKNCQFVVQ